MRIVVNCPCGAAVTVSARQVGCHALCPRCGCMFEVKPNAPQPAGGGAPPASAPRAGWVPFAVLLLVGATAVLTAGGWYVVSHIRGFRDIPGGTGAGGALPHEQPGKGEAKSPQAEQKECARVNLESLLLDPAKYRERHVQFEGAVLAATRKPDSPGFLVVLAQRRDAAPDDEVVVCHGFLSCTAKSIAERRWMRVRGKFVGWDKDGSASALCIHCELVVPEQLEAYRELMDGARKHSEENQWRQAAETFRKARELFAESKESDEWLDADEALSAACRHVEFNDLVQRGRESLDTRRYDLAQQQLREALDLFPLHEDAQRLFHKALFEELVLRGQADLAQDCLSDAASDFRQALATARSHLDRACEQRAEESLEGVSREHLKRGRTAREQGRLDQAVDAFRSALHILPESVELREELASVLVDSARQLLQTAKYVEALPLIREAHRELAPNDREYAALFDDIDHAVNQGEVLRLPVAHRKIVFLGFTQSDEQLILVAESGQVELVDVSSGRPIVEFAGLESTAIMAALADNADRLAVCDRNGLVRVWQLETTGKPRMLFASKMDQLVTCLALDPNGETLAVGTADGRLAAFPVSLSATQSWTVTSSSHFVLARFSANGEVIATAAEDDSLAVWHASGDHPRRQIASLPRAHADSITCLQFLPHHMRFFATASRGGLVSWCWQERQMEPVRHLLVGDTLVTHYVFHADAQRAVGYDRETIAVYGNPTDSAGQQVVAAAQVNRIEARQGLLRIVTVNHAANLLASIGDSGTAKVWRLP